MTTDTHTGWCVHPIDLGVVRPWTLVVLHPEWIQTRRAAYKMRNAVLTSLINGD